ncbi:MAG: hypothetical protein ACO3IL_05685 [Steroidobacteraceae bacterium]
MTKSILPKFGITTIDSAAHSTANPRLAATIYAFDVPLHAENPYTTSAGDGIANVRVIWNFTQTDRAGNSPSEIAKRWHDSAWIERTPNDPLAICRRAFDEFDRLKGMMQMGRGLPQHYGAACRVTNTRKAAVMSALGHPLIGWQRNPRVTTWCFHEAAAADAALYDDPALYTKLPDSGISYAKGAITGHERMVEAIKNIQFARVEHRGRVALIGRDCAGEKLNQLEKILYRK